MASVLERVIKPKRLKPSTPTARRLAAEVSQINKKRRVVRGRDRKFIQLYADGGYKNPDQAALDAGFKEPYAGGKLVSRLQDLIDAERIRRGMNEQMELDEALRLTAEGARDVTDRKTQATFLTLILRSHGVLSDKPLPTGDRRSLAAQVAAVIEKIRSKQGTGGGSSTIRLRAAMQTVESRQTEQVDVTIQPADDDSTEPPDADA